MKYLKGRLKRPVGTALFCLLALFAQMGLPVLHVAVEHAVEVSNFGTVQTGIHVDRGCQLPRLTSDSDGKVGHKHHSPDSCPICQAILATQNYFRTSNTPMVSIALETLEILPLEHACIMTPLFFRSGVGPRSPPHFI